MPDLTRSHRPIDLRRRFLLAAAGCDVLVMGVATAVLAGWLLDLEPLKRIAPGLVEMNPLTAVSFLLLGTALWLSLRPLPTRGSKAFATTLCLLVVAFGLSRLLAVVTVHDLAWDQWLFHSSLHGNRIAPNTAFCLLLLALSTALVDVESRHGIRPAQLLSLCGGGVAAVALIGYVYSTESLYGLPTYIPMALHTAICAIVLSFGVLSARPDRGIMAVATGDDLGGLLARRLLAVTIAGPVLLGWLRMVAVRREWIPDHLSNAVLVIAVAALFSAIVWANARVLRTIDAERRQAEQRYRAVVQQTAEGIYLLDVSTQRVIESNAAFHRLLGYTHEQADHLFARDFVDQQHVGIKQQIAETEDPDQPVTGESQYKRQDGSTVEVQANASIITVNGQAVVCTVVHDITRRKRAEREIQEKNRQLVEIARSERQALAALKQTQSQLVQTEKLAGLGQMVAGVAHEINNPLSFVSNNVAVLQRDLAAIRKLLQFYQQADEIIEAANKPLLEEIRDLAERIDLPYTLLNTDDLIARSREGLGRIQQIVKDLREFARLDESDLHEVDLNEGIASTVNIIRGTGKKKRVDIVMDLQPLPRFACYPAKVNQVVMNLLANAIDASSENSKVTVRSRSTTEGDVDIQVEDQGTGIAPEAMSRIFDPFYTTKPPGQGTGLGLSISYGIVRNHGGTIDVQSQLGKGTCFTVRLPRRA